MAANPSFVTLPAQTSFLHGLADIVLRKHQSGDVCSARPWVLLPTRRSCQMFERAYLERSGQKVALLPHIMPLGDIEPTALLQLATQLEKPLPQLPPPPMSDLQRTMLLIQPWLAYAKGHLSSEDHLTWQSMQQALQELLQMYDACEEHAVQAESWKSLVPDALQTHVRVHSQLIAIIAEHWPQMQRESGYITRTAHRNALLEIAHDLLTDSAPPFPIIAAGSTGTIPVTAKLLHAIASMEQGEVVLPVYDIGMQAGTQLRADHPQANLHHFCGDARVHLLGEVSTRTDALRTIWQADLPPCDAQAFAHVHPISCETNRDQCKLAALLVKQTMQAGKRVGVVTPNQQTLKQLAQFCDAEGMHYASAAAAHLGESAHGALWLMLCEYAAQSEDAAKLLALLRQVAVLRGDAAQKMHALIAEIEVELLRNYPIAGGLQALVRVAERREGMSRDAVELLHHMQDALMPLLGFFERAEQTHTPEKFSAIFAAHFAAYARLCEGCDGDERLQNWCEALQQHGEKLGEIDPTFYPLFVQEALQREQLRTPLRVDAPLHLLTPMEARLMQFDRVIVLDMNEGDWPHETSDTLWLNDTLRAGLSLPTRAEQAGRMAHDIWSLLHQEEVYLLRPERVGGSPATPSRFWNRILLQMQRAGAEERVQQEAQQWRTWVAEYYTVAPFAEPVVPAPQPPAEAIPRRLSITKYEALQRDPYAVYAEEILQLKPLDAIAQLPDSRLYGNVVHKVMELFCRTHYEEGQPLEMPVLEQIIARVFARYDTMPIVQSVWRWRLESVAEYVLEHMRERAEVITRAEAELRVEKEVAGITLYGRIDRVEYNADGVLAVADYKTGSPPENKEFMLGYASQLPLAALALSAQHLQDGYYVKVGTRRDLCEFKSLHNAAKKEEVWQETLDAYAQWLQEWNQKLLSGQMQFLAEPRPKFAKSYKRFGHLERLDEWEYLRQAAALSENASAAVA